MPCKTDAPSHRELLSSHASNNPGAQYLCSLVKCRYEFVRRYDEDGTTSHVLAKPPDQHEWQVVYSERDGDHARTYYAYERGLERGAIAYIVEGGGSYGAYRAGRLAARYEMEGGACCCTQTYEYADAESSMPCATARLYATGIREEFIYIDGRQRLSKRISDDGSQIDEYDPDSGALLFQTKRAFMLPGAAADSHNYAYQRVEVRPDGRIHQIYIVDASGRAI